MKRRAKELAARVRITSAASPDLTEEIDRELARLPEKYREAIVLCDLEDLPRKTVAQKLGIPEGTLSSRLTTARKMLGDGLLKKGLVVPAAALSTVAVPATLHAATTQVAAIAAGHVAGIVPVAVTELTRQVTLSLFLAKLQVPAICLGLAALIAVATGAAIHSFDRNQASRTTESAPQFAESLIAGTGQIFQPYGIAPGRSVTLLPDGCLLDLNQAASWGHVGVRSTVELRGDMHFEARYEILNAPARVDAGYGAHIGLALNTGNKAAGAGGGESGRLPGQGQPIRRMPVAAHQRPPSLPNLVRADPGPLRPAGCAAHRNRSDHAGGGRSDRGAGGDRSLAIYRGTGAVAVALWRFGRRQRGSASPLLRCQTRVGKRCSQVEPPALSRCRFGPRP